MSYPPIIPTAGSGSGSIGARVCDSQQCENTDLFRFVIPKLHAKWIQFSIAKKYLAAFYRESKHAASPRFYCLLPRCRNIRDAHTEGTCCKKCLPRRRVCVVHFWFWLRQVRISDFVLRIFPSSRLIHQFEHNPLPT